MRSIPDARPRSACWAAPNRSAARSSRCAAARPWSTKRHSPRSLRKPAARMPAFGSVSRIQISRATTRTSARLGARCRFGSGVALSHSSTGSRRYGSALPRSAGAVAVGSGVLLHIRAQLAARSDLDAGDHLRFGIRSRLSLPHVRLFDTVLPYPNEGAALYWVWFLFVVELTAFLDITLFLMIMSRYADRHAEADRLQESFVAAPNSEWPTVDVFIPTYN